MSSFENVTITKKANIYFDGKVTSRTVTFEDGSEKTLGIMLPGDYEFNTAKAELMEIIAGELDIQIKGDTEWQAIKGGEAFHVPAESSFKLKIHSITDYCCSFID